MGGKGDGGKHDSGTAGPDDVVGGGRGGDVDELLLWDGVPPMFSFRDPDGNALVITEVP